MPIKHITYHDKEIPLEAFVAHPDEKKRPAVIFCHAWRGRDPSICEKAQLVAQWGYVGFALDMYGKGVLGNSMEENTALKAPFIQDRSYLQRRVLKGFETACSLPYIDTDRIAVIGYGFGAICALDLARSGAPLKGAVSIYGHFDPPPSSLIKPISAKILVLHGYNDPVAPQSELLSFQKEMDQAGVDWQLHLYGSTFHAFASKDANYPEGGILYNPLSTQRAWNAIHQFLKEIF